MRTKQAMVLGAALLSTSYVVPSTAADTTGQANRSGPGGDVSILSVPSSKSSISVLTVNGENILVHSGADGAIVVDTGGVGTDAAVLKAIASVSAKPIRYVVNTSASPTRVGNNAALSLAGQGFVASRAGFREDGRFVEVSSAPILARANVLAQMSGASNPAYSTDALPQITFSEGQQNLFINNESIEIVPMPAAHSDGDSIVIFRQSDVIASGNIVDMEHFPEIDIAHGGSINGELDALNRLVDIVVPALPLYWRDGGTILVPARGRLAQAEDLVQYRDMVTIVRDRVQALVSENRSLAQVKAANPTAGFDRRYGSKDGRFSSDKFVTAVYQSLRSTNKNGKPK